MFPQKKKKNLQDNGGRKLLEDLLWGLPREEQGVRTGWGENGQLVNWSSYRQSRYIVLDIHKWKPGSLGLNIGGYGIVNPLLHCHHVSLLPWKWLRSSIAIQMEGVFESTFIHPIFNTETKVANQPGRFALSQWYPAQPSTIMLCFKVPFTWSCWGGRSRRSRQALELSASPSSQGGSRLSE